MNGNGLVEGREKRAAQKRGLQRSRRVRVNGDQWRPRSCAASAGERAQGRKEGCDAFWSLKLSENLTSRQEKITTADHTSNTSNASMFKLNSLTSEVNAS